MAPILFLICFVALCKGHESNSLKLEQVVIFSRHNVRTPLTTNVVAYSPKKWPKFNKSSGQLTQRGVLLESYIAEYISEWLASEDFIKGCPKQEEVLIYANTKPRTRATAKAFAEAAFRSCNISIHHNKNIDVFDPVFLPIFHNNSEYFKQAMIQQMENKLKNKDLTKSYLELNRILDLQNSDMCLKHSMCDLSKKDNGIFYKDGEEPDVSGALHIANNIIDTFVMSYYEGFPIENVAWGEIKTDKQWKLLADIMRQNLNVRFNFQPGSRDIAEPLLRYMFDIFSNGNPKLTVLFGHDSNFCSIISALGFKEFDLIDHFEPYPIGGKLMFEKWSDGENKYLKIEYVYQTSLQLRNAVKLSMEQPPRRIVLELKDCKIDERGLCPWDNFTKIFF